MIFINGTIWSDSLFFSVPWYYTLTPIRVSNAVNEYHIKVSGHSLCSRNPYNYISEAMEVC